MGRDGVSSLQMTRDDLLTWSTSFFHAIYLGLPKNLTPVSPAHLRPTNKRHRRRRGKRRRPARPRERKRRHRGDGLRGDIGGWTWEVGAAAADCQGHRPSTQASGGVIGLGGEVLSVELMDLGGLCMVVFTCRIREEVRNKGVLVHLGIAQIRRAEEWALYLVQRPHAPPN